MGKKAQFLNIGSEYFLVPEKNFDINDCFQNQDKLLNPTIYHNITDDLLKNKFAKKYQLSKIWAESWLLR